MNTDEFNGLKDLVNGIKGTENTLTHLNEEGEKIKKYAISALEDFIDTWDKLKEIIVDSGLWGKEFLGTNYCVIEKDTNGKLRYRTSWSCGSDHKFEFDLLYGDTYGKILGDIYYRKTEGQGGSYIDEYEAAKVKIEFIKTHTWKPEGYVIMKQKADLLKERIKYLINDTKNRLETILKNNKETISNLSSLSGATYENVKW